MSDEQNENKTDEKKDENIEIVVPDIEKKIKATKKKPNKKTTVKKEKDLNLGIELNSSLPIIAIGGIFAYLFFLK